MNVNYFLGANSGDGFFSLYDGFACDRGNYLYLIKGGPGCGKSGFMRRIAEKAKDLGYDTETILCSGDPDSLDGLYIPALKLGFCDATAPHIKEPSLFAYDSYYINLGQFCRRADNAGIAEYSSAYKKMYNTAYSYLSAAASVKRAAFSDINGSELRGIAECRAKSTVKRIARPRANETPASVKRRFIRCIGCRGELTLSDSIAALCERVYRISDRFGLADVYLKEAEKTALSLGDDVIVCPSPLCPEAYDAVILPEHKLGFVSSSVQNIGVSCRNVRLDALIPHDVVLSYRNELKKRESLIYELTELAAGYLKKAKSLHDRLEAEYRPYMDFAALDSFTEDFVSELFS